MMNFLRTAVALALLALLPSTFAQTVVTQPSYINPGTATDLGNGPVEIRIVQGNALLATASSTGVGSTSGSSTTLTLTATPTTVNVPCVGCNISGSGITSGTTVTAFNNGLVVTISTLTTVPSNSALAWGTACPASPPVGVVLPVQASVGGDLPFYTQARVCGYSPNGPGAAALVFAIGAH